MATNCLADSEPTRLPVGQDLDAAREALEAATQALSDIQWRVQRIARGADVTDCPEQGLVQGDELPTFAHIGELYMFVLDARSSIEEAASMVDSLERGLRDLDMVRVLYDA